MVLFRNICLLLLAFLVMPYAFAQRNAMKFGILGPLAGNYTISVEQVIHSNHTINYTAGYWNTNSGLINFNQLFTPGENLWYQKGSPGWHGTVEMRNYFGFQMDRKPFYWGPYFRLWSHGFIMNDYIRNEQVREQQLFDVNARFRGIGAGIQLGYHLMLNDRLWLDFYFIGLGVDRVKMVADYRAVDSDGFDYSLIEGDVSGAFVTQANFIKKSVSLRTTSEALFIELPVTIPTFRAGINIAYTLD